MLKSIKWLAIIILLPILVLKEVYEVFKDSGFSIPDADEVLNNIKSTPEQTVDYSDRID